MLVHIWGPRYVYPPCLREIPMKVPSQSYRIAGTVKFDASVPVEKLITFVNALRSQDPDRWVDIYVRPAGDSGCHYIGIHYILTDGRKKTEWNMLRNFLQYFCDQLGTRPNTKSVADHPVAQGLKSWSFSKVVTSH
jgi:hypothetical protein